MPLCDIFFKNTLDCFTVKSSYINKITAPCLYTKLKEAVARGLHRNSFINLTAFTAQRDILSCIVRSHISWIFCSHIQIKYKKNASLQSSICRLIGHKAFTARRSSDCINNFIAIHGLLLLTIIVVSRIMNVWTDHRNCRNKFKRRPHNDKTKFRPECLPQETSRSFYGRHGHEDVSLTRKMLMKSNVKIY